VKTEKNYPPNYQDIKKVLNPPESAVFAYGSTIHNPSGQEIPPDIIIHEAVHEKQQRLFGTPELWWQKYLLDLDFRLDQEVEAYSAQYQYLKEYLPNKAMKEVLTDLAQNLVKLYSVGLTYQEACTRIRKYGKNCL
jgi:hypothetical protein